MATQEASIDVSQLRAFALGISPDHVSTTPVFQCLSPRVCKQADAIYPALQPQDRDLSPQNATRPQNQHGRVRTPTASPSIGRTGRQHSPSPISTHSRPPYGSTSQSRTSGTEPQRLHQKASQPGLPSTIPDSLRRRMLTDSQSEGDTQPISQSIYEQYNNRIKVHHAATRIPPSQNSTEAQHATFRTPQQGESGYVDLLAAFEQPSPNNDIEASGGMADEDDIDPLSQPQDIRADIFPESKRFQPPKTPASQGRKRKREIKTSSQGQTTPKLPINPFAGQSGSVDGLMSASQLFQATQAVTSPLANNVTSDGLSERPSPMMHDIQRPSTAGSLSSPVKLPRSSMVRAVTEPQTVYVSMKESQEARDRFLEARRTDGALPPDDLSDDDFDTDPQLKRRLRQRRYDLEAKQQFAEVAARSEAAMRHLGHSRRNRVTNATRRASPRGSGTQVAEPVLISDDAPAEDVQGSITEEETEREEAADDVEEDDLDELGEDNKENIEVPATISRIRQGPAHIISSQPTPSHNQLPQSKIASPSKRTIQVLGSSQVSRSQDNSTWVEISNQADAVADSQPSQNHAIIKTHGKRQGTRALSEPRSSHDSRILVPHSQISEVSGALRSTDIPEEHQGILDPPRSPLQRSQPPHEVHATPDIDHTLSEPFSRGAVTGQPRTEDSRGNVTRWKGSVDPQLKGAHPVETSVPQQPAPESTIPDLDEGAQGLSRPHELVPDSSAMMPSPRTTPQPASKRASGSSIPNASRGSTLFETAPERPVKIFSPQRRVLRSSAQSSPEKSRLPRTMSDIAADPSPPDMIGDVDIDMNILSNEDRQFQRTLNGSSPVAPSKKRRRGGRGFAVGDRDELDVLHNLPASPLPPPSSAVSKITPIKIAPAGITPVPSSSPLQTTSPAMATRNRKNQEQYHSKPELEHETSRGQELAAEAASEPSTYSTASTNCGAAKSTSRQAEQSIPARKGQPRTGNEEAVHEPSIRASNRVFALFNGSVPAYHPATCLHVTGGDEPRYRVRFDDGAIDTISSYGIKRLELRNGDSIKVDLPGLRGKRYVVEGMQDPQRPATPPDPATPSRRGRQHSTNDSAFPETDIHGFATVLASPMPPATGHGTEAETSQKAIPLSQIYFTQTLWASFRDRPYIHPSNIVNSLTGLQTPSERPSTPSTPSSRTRRITKTTSLAQPHSTATDTRGIFKGMIFAITNVDRAEDSHRAKEHIIKNGGTILENGFDESFSVPVLQRTTDPSHNSPASFELTSQAQEAGFACLIADRHCRRAKFIQALALGIPCLATRWISDCVSKQRVLPWAPYLLPAGESTFLGGAVRSRNLHPFSAENASLSDMVANRPLLLKNASVLLIMEKGQEKIMKQHPLLTHALGASKVSRAISGDAAAKAVADAQALNNPWDWVFSYDKEKEVEKRLFGGSEIGKKRKRGQDSEVSDKRVKRAKTKVMNNEFVIQSLILGMLIDE